MKAMSRQELAERAGITTKTLTNWMRPHMPTLRRLGLRPRQIMPPSVVAWLADTFCIDIGE